MWPIFRLFGMIFRFYRRQILLGYFATFGAAIAGLAIPKVLGVGIDRVLDPQNETRGLQALLILALVIALLGLTRGLFSWARVAVSIPPVIRPAVPALLHPTPCARRQSAHVHRGVSRWLARSKSTAGGTLLSGRAMTDSTTVTARRRS